MLTAIPHHRAFWIDRSQRRAHSKPAPPPQPKAKHNLRCGMSWGDARRLYGTLPKKPKKTPPVLTPVVVSPPPPKVLPAQTLLLADWSVTTKPLVKAVYRKNAATRAAMAKFNKALV